VRLKVTGEPRYAHLSGVSKVGTPPQLEQDTEKLERGFLKLRVKAEAGHRPVEK